MPKARGLSKSRLLLLHPKTSIEKEKLSVETSHPREQGSNVYLRKEDHLAITLTLRRVPLQCKCDQSCFDSQFINLYQFRTQFELDWRKNPLSHRPA